ncbi:hypothetical protein LXL04_023242 [Taraxacum kok-saghyz]
MKKTRLKSNRCRNWNQSLVILTNSKMVEVRVAMAEGLFKKMIEDALKFFKGIVFWKSILPDVGVCNSLIYRVCSLCCCDEVLNMLKEMEDEVFYILTNAYCKEYVIEDVEVVINLTSLDK